MRQLVYLAFSFLGFITTPASADIAGEVVFSGGEVRIGKLVSSSISAGTKINEGDALMTGADGHLHIKFPDKGMLILRPNSSAIVSDYSFFPENPTQSKMRIVVLHGVVRSITGGWAKAAPTQFRLNTPIAAVGVRGTDFTVVTNSEITRASVSSGGIIMTPLGNSCSSQGLGPCEGVLSAELFSGRPQFFLQAKTGGGKPEILDGQKLGVHPDTATPPSASEPPKGLSDKSNTLPFSRDLEPIASGTQAPKVSPAPVTALEQIKWGRWAKLLDSTGADDIRVNRTMVAANAKFALFRDNSPSLIMPKEGVASFRLVSQDSFFYNATSNMTAPATIENAKFSVDFGAQTFTTDFSMRGESLNINIQAKGGLFPDGRFIANAVSSNASVSGALGGTSATQAGLLFHSPINTNVTAYGATYWAR